ncbi:MAG: glycosyltransferase [Fimbriiglobus sp.]
MPRLLDAPFAVETPTAMRVSFVIDSLSRAGTESQLLALLQHLDRETIEPSLVLLDGRSASSRELEPAGIPILRLGVTRLVGLNAARASLRLRAFWREHPPEAVATYFLDSAYFAVPVARLMGVAKVVRVRNNLGYWLTRKHRLGNRLLRPMIDGILTNSEAGREALLQTDGLPEERVQVIENGVDLERFAGFPAPFSTSRPPTIGCVANLRPVKNIDGFLRAAKLVVETHPQARFIVAGDGEERVALETLRRELGLEQHFEFRGSVRDVPGFLRQLDVAVLPSHSEGMSNAILEYAAAGRAIIATDVGANARLLPSGTGQIVPAGNTFALASAIRQYLDQPTLARSHGHEAKNHVTCQHSREAMVTRFEDYFLNLRGGKA